jgi:hypothetical protein
MEIRQGLLEWIGRHEAHLAKRISRIFLATRLRFHKTS